MRQMACVRCSGSDNGVGVDGRYGKTGPPAPLPHLLFACTLPFKRFFVFENARRAAPSLVAPKRKQRKIARDILRSLAPLLGTAGSLSDCGIKPTIAELNFSRR